jgi:hypothetical protein
MTKTDLSKEFKEVWTASDKKPKFVDVPQLNYLMFDGVGLPDKTPEFGNAMGALFSTAYTIKFTLKAKKKDFKVMAPETVWKIGPGEKRNPKDWPWTAMIPVPDFVTKTDLEKARKSVKERSQKKKQPAPQVEKVRLEKFKDGKCVQIMQFGPYEKAVETYKTLKKFAEESGYIICGHCKEIYYNDPRKVAPSKIKTLVRYPVKKA